MLSRVGVVLFGLLFCVASWAMEEETCYEYRRTVADPWVDAAGADAQILAYCYNEGGSSYNCSSSGLSKSSQSCTFTVVSSIGADDTAPFAAVLNRDCFSIPANNPVSNGEFTVSGLRQVADCPDDACAINAGETELASGDGDSAPRTICLGGCNATINGVAVSAGGKYSGYYKHSGTSCDTEEEATGQADGANCITTAAGRFCASKQNKNCGVFNGETMCAASVPEGQCVLMPGGAICEVTAESGPRDGEGEPLPADAQVGAGGVGNPNGDYSYYSNSTVSSSSTTVVGAGSGSDGGGSDTDGQDGDDGAICEGEEDCYGGLPEEVTECSEDLVACVVERASGAWETIVDAVPILSFAADLHTAFSGSSSCPEAPVTILGDTHDVMAPVCVLLAANGTLLQLIFQVCWGILGVRILIKPDGEAA